MNFPSPYDQIPPFSKEGNAIFASISMALIRRCSNAELLFPPLKKGIFLDDSSVKHANSTQWRHQGQ